MPKILRFFYLKTTINLLLMMYFQLPSSQYPENVNLAARQGKYLSLISINLLNNFIIIFLMNIGSIVNRITIN